MTVFLRFVALVLVLLAVFGAATPAYADDDDGYRAWWPWGKRDKHGERSEGRVLGADAPALVKQECGSCHITYPAGLLAAGSWRHLMANLSQHFGNDASLDGASTAAIASYLADNAGTYKRVNEMPPGDRITASYWFLRKHNKHVSASVWTRPSIGSASNCAACHAGAEQGNFNEHSVRIPN